MHVFMCNSAAEVVATSQQTTPVVRTQAGTVGQLTTSVNGAPYQQIAPVVQTQAGTASQLTTPDGGTPDK